MAAYHSPRRHSRLQYTEGLKVGYRWFEAEGKPPLFPFGFGLSYTAFSYSRIRVTPGPQVEVSFQLANIGKRAGAEAAQMYVALPPAAGEPFKRLVAWEKVRIAAGEKRTLTLRLDPLYLSIFDAERDNWRLLPGEYTIYVGGSSRSTPLSATVRL